MSATGQCTRCLSIPYKSPCHGFFGSKKSTLFTLQVESRLEYFKLSLEESKTDPTFQGPYICLQLFSWCGPYCEYVERPSNLIDYVIMSLTDSLIAHRNWFHRFIYFKLQLTLNLLRLQWTLPMDKGIVLSIYYIIHRLVGFFVLFMITHRKQDVTLYVLCEKI